MKIAFFSLVAVLLAVGLWTNGAARGYEQGKKDAAEVLRPHGIVVVRGDGTCYVFDKPGQKIEVPSSTKTKTVMLVQP